MPINITFQSPSYAEGNDAAVVFPELHVRVEGFDLDHSALTVYADLHSGDNWTLATPAPFTNEYGDECGDIAWRIAPAPELLDALVRRQDFDTLRVVEMGTGRIYGRVIVTAGGFAVDEPQVKENE